MYKILYILLFTLCAGSVSAQKMPERGEVRKGNRQYNKGNYEKSAERYLKALNASPGSFEAGYNLGNALYKAERFDKAEQVITAVTADTLRTDQERSEAFYNLGNTQFKQQKYKEALESYKQSLRLNPDDQEAKYNYAYTKKLLDDQQKDGGGGDDNKDKDNKEQNKDQQQNQQEGQDGQDKSDPDQKPGDQQENPADQQQGDNGDDQQGEGQPQPVPAGISPQEQEQMLDAIQAQEDKTQEKLKEKQGVVVRGKKNW